MIIALKFRTGPWLVTTPPVILFHAIVKATKYFLLNLTCRVMAL